MLDYLPFISVARMSLPCVSDSSEFRFICFEDMLTIWMGPCLHDLFFVTCSLISFTYFANSESGKYFGTNVNERTGAATQQAQHPNIVRPQSQKSAVLDESSSSETGSVIDSSMTVDSLLPVELSSVVSASLSGVG